MYLFQISSITPPIACQIPDFFLFQIRYRPHKANVGYLWVIQAERSTLCCKESDINNWPSQALLFKWFETSLLDMTKMD